MDKADIIEQAGKTDVTKIFFTDLNGRLMNLIVNPDHLASILAGGVGFDGSSIAGMGSVDNSDRLLVPVAESYRTVTFPDETLGFFVGNIHRDCDARANADPRAVLERVLAAAASEFGYRFTVGPEHEFFLLRGDDFDAKAHSDRAGYFHTAPHDKGEAVRNRIVAVLKSCGVDFEKAHHEVTPSQHEINLGPADPLSAADRTLLFNHVTQKVAAAHGLHATFMPKPFDNFNRSAFHIHLSLADAEGNNLFYDADAEGHLSATARHFIGGILKFAREASIVMASTFNSYKAYVLEREAPVVRGWGFRNRSSMVRVPYVSQPQQVRIELRCPDPLGNVYLQLAALIGMGLEGVRRQIDCGAPDVGSTYARRYRQRMWDRRFLPKTMYEALVEAEKSAFLKELLGDRIYENYLQIKIADWEDHRVHITQRELDKYL